MIDLIYKTLQTIINKENNGYLSPTEFNMLCNQVQEEIFRGYFTENKDKLRDNKGLVNKGHSNLDFNNRQKVAGFIEQQTISGDIGKFDLPTNLYLIEEDSVISLKQNGEILVEQNVIEEIDNHVTGYLKNAINSASELYPVYENYGRYLQVIPSTIKHIKIKYIRKPKKPMWTYTMVMNKEMFNPSSSTFQDFELHSSEFSNIVIRMMSFFGINLRENEVIQIAEQLKNELNIKENN